MVPANSTEQAGKGRWASSYVHHVVEATQQKTLDFIKYNFYEQIGDQKSSHQR